MTRDQVDILFQAYLIQKARCNFLRKRISELESYLVFAKEDQIYNLISTTAKMDDTPHGNGVSNPTERAGIALASGYESPDVKDISDNIEVLKRYLTVTERDVSFVDAWMECLVGTDHKVVFMRAVEQKTWNDCITEIAQACGITYSRSGIQKIFRHSMEKVYAVAMVDITEHFLPAVRVPDLPVREDDVENGESEENKPADSQGEPVESIEVTEENKEQAIPHSDGK